MSFFAFTLVVVAAIAHAAWNLASKKASSSGLTFIWLGAVASTVFYLPLAVVDISLNGLELRSFVLGATCPPCSTLPTCSCCSAVMQPSTSRWSTRWPAVRARC